MRVTAFLGGSWLNAMDRSLEGTAVACPPRYRPSVAGIIQNAAGLVLLGERRDTVGGWQFPQGGVEPGETPVAALSRELEEEIGLRLAQYTVGESRGPYRYLFPPGRTKQGYNGQEQHYYRLLLRISETQVGAGVAMPEFRALRWLEPASFRLEWLPEMKRAVYRQVFVDFFGLSLD